MMPIPFWSWKHVAVQRPWTDWGFPEGAWKWKGQGVGGGQEKDEDKTLIKAPSSFFFLRLFVLRIWVHCSCTDGREPSCGYWEPNSGPWEKQSVLLTAEPSLQLKAPSLIFRESPQTPPLFQLGYVAKQAQRSVCSSKFLEEIACAGWWDGSADKSTNCSSKGPEFKSQQPHGGSQPSVMWSDALFWCVWREWQCTHMHKINK